MNYNVYYFVLIILVGIVSYNAFPSVMAQANNTSNVFTDSKSGVSFHYPSDWRIASKDYTNIIYGNLGNTNASNSSRINISTPIVIALPSSLNGASFGILTQILPFSVSMNNYFDSNKNQLRLAGLSLNNVTHISISNLKGVKYDTISPNGIIKTQMLFVKDSNGIVITINSGFTNKLKNVQDINSIINSLTFKPTGHNITNFKNAGSNDIANNTIAISKY